MALGIMTLSIMTSIKMTISIMMHIKMTQGIMTLSIISPSITTLLFFNRKLSNLNRHLVVLDLDKSFPVCL
jgi:hypothetical protein